MRYSGIGAIRYRKSLRSRSVGAAVLVAVLAVTVLVTLVVGAAAANKKASHTKQVRHRQTTAHVLAPHIGAHGPSFTG